MSNLNPFITLPYKLERAPPPFETYEAKYSDKYPESLVRYVLKEFTKKGDKVFDPFAGLGTTLFVAEEMGRIPYGMEADRKRQEWVAGQLENWLGLHCDDTANMLDYGFPKMDFAMTSPVYMPKHHKWNPLYGGDPAHAGYDQYLRRMAYIFAQLAKLMKRHAYVVVQLDNLRGRVFTPLVRDVGHAVSQSFRPEGETIVKWANGPEDYPCTHCLIFKNSL